MAVHLPPRRKHRHLLLKSPHFLTPRRLRLLAIVLAFLIVCVALRALTALYYLSQPDFAPSTVQFDPAAPESRPLRALSDSEASVNLWRHVEHDCPPEKHPPDPDLYATGEEKAFAIGLPDAASHKPLPGDPASFWQMNSRAMLYSPNPVCFYGRSLQNLLSFEKRGTGSCQVLSVVDSKLHPAHDSGLNESCAAFRYRYISSMYGQEMFYSFENWMKIVSKPIPAAHSRRKSVEWTSKFAIMVPKYEWSHNICHYNRIWNFIMYIIRNLKLFVPDADSIDQIDIKFRSGLKYDRHWHVGVRNATLEYLQREVGKKITVGKLRFDYLRDFQCIERGILLGREGRIDSFPFFNDTPVWRPEQQLDDSHVPTIPHDALWFREAVFNSTGLGTVGEYTGSAALVGRFTSIRLPPRKIGILQRSRRSRRRLTSSGYRWLTDTLQEMGMRYNMQIVNIRTNEAMTFAEQVRQLRDIGVGIGLHGANMVNTVFMPPGGAIFEIFPWRYVRFYYAGGANSGLRYSFHEPEGGRDRNCSFSDKVCFMKYRESLIYLSARDRSMIRSRIQKSVEYVVDLHRKYPTGRIPLRRQGNLYYFDK